MLLSRTRTQTRFVLLPPSQSAVPGFFHNVEANSRRYDELFAAMQRFRGRIYREDGAVPSAGLTADGRHQVPIDPASWHVLSLDAHGHVISCLRYLEETGAFGFNGLWVRHAAIARCPDYGGHFRSAIEQRLERARSAGVSFGEVGGWAVAEEHRGTLEPLRIILAAYGLLELLGGCSGVATATFRHGSAPILRRIGLSSLAAAGRELPPYFDPTYACEMQVLEFDSDRPAEKYRGWVQELAGMLVSAPVVCRESVPHAWLSALPGSEMARPMPMAIAAVA
jgi:hypothetical protein